MYGNECLSVGKGKVLQYKHKYKQNIQNTFQFQIIRCNAVRCRGGQSCFLCDWCFSAPNCCIVRLTIFHSKANCFISREIPFFICITLAWNRVTIIYQNTTESQKSREIICTLSSNQYTILYLLPYFPLWVPLQSNCQLWSAASTLRYVMWTKLYYIPNINVIHNK